MYITLLPRILYNIILKLNFTFLWYIHFMSVALNFMPKNRDKFLKKDWYWVIISSFEYMDLFSLVYTLKEFNA